MGKYIKGIFSLQTAFLCLISVNISCDKDTKDFIANSTPESFILTDLTVAQVELDRINTEDPAITLSWEDVSYGVPTVENYTIEISDSETFENVHITQIPSGNFTYTFSMVELNNATADIELPPFQWNELYLRVSSSLGANQSNISYSNEVTLMVYPFIDAPFKGYYLVGDATSAGWSNDNNNHPLFRDQDSPNPYFYTGYFNAGAFKLLEEKGSWHPQWGNNDGVLGVSGEDGSNEPGIFSIPTAGYYTIAFDLILEGSSFSITPYDETGSTTYTAVGIIGAAVGGWGDADEINMVQDVNNPHLWYALDVNFTQGEQFLIRANNAWSNVWRYNNSNSFLYGQAFLGDGNNFSFEETTGSYDVWFNDLDGSYAIIPN